MFIDFAGMMTNINYIINIYKTKKYYKNKIKHCIEIKFNDIENYEIILESYDDEKERNKRFDELINLINK